MVTTQSTGNGIYIYTTYKNGDDWGMVHMALFYPQKILHQVGQYAQYIPRLSHFPRHEHGMMGCRPLPKMARIKGSREETGASPDRVNGARADSPCNKGGQEPEAKYTILMLNYKRLLKPIVWVKQCQKPSPSRHNFYRWYKPSNMGWFFILLYLH